MDASSEKPTFESYDSISRDLLAAEYYILHAPGNNVPELFLLVTDSTGMFYF